MGCALGSENGEGLKSWGKRRKMIFVLTDADVVEEACCLGLFRGWEKVMGDGIWRR